MRLFYSWQVLLAISICFSSLSILLSRVIMKEQSSRPIAYAIIFQLLVGLLIACAGVFFERINFLFLLRVWPNILLSVLLYIFANIFSFNAYKKTEAATYAIIFSSRAIFTILASSLFLKQGLQGWQIVGAIAIFLGIFVANMKKGKVAIGKGEVLSFLAAVAFGLANTNDKQILQAVPLYTYVIFNFIGTAFVMMVLLPKEVVYMKQFLRKTVFIRLSLLGGLYAIASIAFFAGLQLSNNSSQFTTINLTVVIVTVLLAILFLSEKKNIWQKIIGAICALLGVVLVG